MMSYPRLSTAIALLWTIGFVAAAQQELEVVHVKDHIHMITGPGGNIGVSAGEDGILIVDDKFERNAADIRKALAGLGGAKLKFVLNTHFHGDHTGGNAAFGAEATIVAHSNVRKRLAEGGSPKEALPEVTFETSASVHFNGEEIRLQYFPNGHTDTDSVLFFMGTNVVHMGDLFFNGRFPFIDLDHGGSVQGYIANLHKAIGLVPKGAKVIPGHGPLSDVEGMKDFHRVLTECVEEIEKEIRRGKGLEQIQAGAVMEKWPEYAGNTDRWVAIVHRSLTERK